MSGLALVLAVPAPAWPLRAGSLFGLGAGALAKDIAMAFFSTLFGLESSLVTSLVSEVMAHLVPATSRVSLAPGSWFASAARGLVPLAPIMVAPLLFAATIGAVLRHDMRRLARAWGVALPVSLMCSAALVQLCRLGLQVTDAMSSFIEQSVYPGLGRAFAVAVGDGIGGGASLGGLGLVEAAFGLLLVLGGMAVWLELALRAAAVELAVFFMPLALAGLVWPATAHWARRMLEVLAALLLAKPVVTAALCLGARAVTAGGGGLESLVTGTAILLMASFAPLMLLKLVPVVEVAAIAHLQGASRQPFHAASRVGRQVVGMTAGAAGAVGGAGGAAGGGAAGGGTGAGATAGGADQLLSQVARDEGLGPAGAPVSRSGTGGAGA